MARSKTGSRTSRPVLSARGSTRGPSRAKPSASRWLATAAGVIAVAAIALWLTGRGDTGQETGAAPFVGGDLHSFVVSPDDPNLLFVGGHQAVSTSTDGGRTWSSVESLQDADAMGWAFLDGVIWLGGHPGLEVSTDAGKTFEPQSEGLPATDIHALGGSGATLYAASPAAGFLASTDGGASWEVRNAGVGQGFMGAMLVDPSDVDRVVAPDMNAGAVESRDGGRTWRALGGVAGAMWVSWDPTNLDRIIVTGSSASAVSLDAGETWTPLDVPAGVSVVQIDPGDPRLWYAAALSPDGTASVSISSDRGSTWAPL